MFKFHCPKCGLTAEGPDDLTGKPCPGCGEKIGGTGAHLAPGDNIGGYEIIRLLGSGGTGDVYLALQLSMNRQIAVKVLYPELTKDGESVRQFFSEVQTLGNIQHGNIVCAFDSGVDQERKLCYLAMQYIPGQPLDAKVEQSGPLPVTKALRIVESIAEALNYVWTKYQLCHRDIKPGNIILNEDDVPMLLDFGAVLRVGENSVTNGLVEGSPCYMSPEQARGEKLTFASDLYSLGETLYFLATGVPPFDDPDVHEILRKQCEAPFPPPAQKAPKSEVPAEVVSFLRKTMAKSPVDRFESWEEFLSELKKVRKAVSGKSSSPARGAARPTPTVKTAAVKAGASAAPKASSLDKLNAEPSPVKRRKSRILLAVNYLLISCLTAGAIAFMLSRRNTESAENRMIEVRAAMKNVRENDKDPEGAKDKIRRARAEAKKFGVKQDVAREIEEECAEEMRFIEMIEAENMKAERIQLDVSALMSELVAARAALKRNFNEENIAEMNRIRTGLMDQSKKILTVSFVRPSNEEKMRQVISAINEQTKTIDEQLKPTVPGTGKFSQSAGNSGTASYAGYRSTSTTAAARRSTEDKAAAAAAEAARKKAAAEEEKARKKKEEEEKARRRKEQYRKKLEQGREKVAREIVLEVRKGNLRRAEQLLALSQDMKAPDADCREMEESYSKWLGTIRGVFQEAKPVLREISPDESNKKDRIYSLAGGNKTLLSRSLILCGYFTEAQNLIQPGDREVLRDISVAYLTPRIERAISKARKGNDKELVDLRQEYEKFESYTDLENTVRARITGGK